MAELRPYQIESITRLREEYRKHTRVLFASSTGSGKTKIFSHIAAAAIDRGKRVLILSHRTEIFTQNIRSMSAHSIPVCKIDAGTKHVSRDALLFVAMCETFKRRMATLTHIKFDLIIVDEAHLSSFFKILDAYPNTHTLGCTATPLNKKQHLYYTSLVQVIDVPELIEAGFLMPCRAYQMQEDLSDITRKKNGDFDERSHFNHYDKSKLYDGVLQSYREKCPGRSTIVYNVSIEHSQKMSDAFNAAGIKSYSITSVTPTAEREWILREFERGAFPVLNNCSCMTTGTDIPMCSAIIINRAISVLSLFIQIVGRGARPCPEIGKTDFVCVDHGLNHDRFGLWSSARKWELNCAKKRSTALGAAPVKSCKQCGAMVLAQTRVCEFCGFVWVPTEKELAQGRLVEVTNNARAAIEGRYLSQLTLAEIIECEKTKAVKASHAWRAVRARGIDAIRAYASLRGHREGWIYRQEETYAIETADGGHVHFSDRRINEMPKLTI